MFDLIERESRIAYQERNIEGKKNIIIKCKNETNNKSNYRNINWTRMKFAGLKKKSTYHEITMRE